MVTHPNDWFDIQDSAKNLFEITLRDPYVKYAARNPSDQQGHEWRGLSSVGNDRPAADQCPRGAAWYKGDACVIAVVRFNQSLVEENLTLTTFLEGKALRTAQVPAEAMGVVILRLPLSKENVTFASAVFTETQKNEGNHIATTSVKLQR